MSEKKYLYVCTVKVRYRSTQTFHNSVFFTVKVFNEKQSTFNRIKYVLCIVNARIISKTKIQINKRHQRYLNDIQQNAYSKVTQYMYIVYKWSKKNFSKQKLDENKQNFNLNRFWFVIVSFLLYDAFFLFSIFSAVCFWFYLFSSMNLLHSWLQRRQVQLVFFTLHNLSKFLVCLSIRHNSFCCVFFTFLFHLRSKTAFSFDLS